MKTKFINFFVILFLSSSIFSQNSIEVTDQTIKIGAIEEQILYFGFAEGDQIIFNFREINDKEIKEIEIIEYPSSSKFSDFKTVKIENKILKVNKTSIYAFRFYNSALGGRICKINISRIPSNPNFEKFNTEVYWEIKQDTTWNTYTKDVVVRYDTINEQKVKKELLKTEFSEEMIYDKTERIHSANNLDYLNKKFLQLNLPLQEIQPNKTKEIKGWVYWIGVGEESNIAWKKNVENFSKAIGGISSIVGGGPLTGYLTGAIPSLVVSQLGEDVTYWFISDYQNANLFMQGQTFYQYDKGKGTSAFGKNSTIKQGSIYLGLLNDNEFQAINVNIKLSILWETNFYRDVNYIEKTLKPVYEKKIFKDPIINTNNIPVLKN